MAHSPSSNDVVRQDLQREHGIAVSLRTAPLRQGLRAEARATLRFETPPGKQLQIDFGATTVTIGGEPVRVHLIVATLSYSRDPMCAPSGTRGNRLGWTAWRAFRRVGGVPREVEIAYRIASLLPAR
jgi:hypothetical protein